MTLGSILIYVGLIGYIGYRRVQGQPVKASRQLFALPVVLVVLGFLDVTQGASLKSIAIVLTVIGAVAAFGLGLLRGRADTLSDRNGSLFMQWGKVSLLLFAGNIAVKLVLDLIGLAAGSTGSTVGKSLLLTFGLTLLGEAIGLRIRTQGATATARARRERSGRGSGGVRGVPAPVAAATPASGFGGAVESHHDRHQDRRREHHDRHRRRHDRDAS
jgi:hypothetical protein